MTKRTNPEDHALAVTTPDVPEEKHQPQTTNEVPSVVVCGYNNYVGPGLHLGLLGLLGLHHRAQAAQDALRTTERDRRGKSRQEEAH
jgi:hypothetical protein